ncbi:MAG: hypothetical protein K2Q26_11350 [Bdellovibrionales bacterium]|nr:hypothetical protein [Bdellovibrionales bacterium]
MKQETINFWNFFLLSLLSHMILLTGCATQNKSVGLGGLIGASTGAAIGGIIDPGAKGKYRTRNVIMGASLGGMTGLVAGNIIGGEMESQKKLSYEKGRASAPQAPAGAMPQLTNPKVESRWVEARTVGNRYIEGHFEYIIAEPVRWNQ